MRAFLQLLCLAAALLIGTPAFVSPAWADSWAMPASSTYHSENGAFRLTIEPAPIGSQLEFFREEIEAEESGHPPDRPPPLGLLEKRDGESWTPLWAKPLVNTVAPVDALVSDHGQVVTFDNWHSIGFGENVIVIYGVDGALVRSMALTELLPEAYFAALPRPVSSLHWRDGARFDRGGELLELDVAFPPEEGAGEQAPVRFQLSLADGGAWSVDTDRLAMAMATAERIERGHTEAGAARIAYLKEPLAAPVDADGPWREYLLEAFLRLTPDYLDSPFPDITILFEPGSERYRESVDWLVESFADLESFPDSAVVVASPHSQEGLLKALEKASRSITHGSLDGGVAYVSVDAGYRAEAERLVAITGARFVWLDPGSAIAQRPERVPGSAEERAADEEIVRRKRAEIDAIFDEIEDD